MRSLTASEALHQPLCPTRRTSHGSEGWYTASLSLGKHAIVRQERKASVTIQRIGPSSLTACLYQHIVPAEQSGWGMTCLPKHRILGSEPGFFPDADGALQHKPLAFFGARLQTLTPESGLGPPGRPC